MRNQRWKPFQDSRGLWNVVIELPSHGGDRRRKVVRAKDKGAAIDRAEKAWETLKQNGDLPTKSETTGEWINEWFTTIALKKIRPKTARTYRYLIEREIIPVIGPTKLDKLTTTDIRKMVHTIVDVHGLSSTTAVQAHRIVSVALKYALWEGKVTRNVAALIDPPRRAAHEAQALTIEEGKRIIAATHGTPPFRPDPLASLWAAVLLTGARQGELLGLELDRITDRTLEISWQLQRFTWEHGCDGTCNRKRGSDCPDRHVTFPADYEVRHLEGGLWLSRPKSRAGYRVLPLVDPLKSILLRHTLADQGPNPHGLVWHMDNGSPIDTRVQSDLWHRMLADVGVTDVRLHEGRHTAVDLLYEAGVPEDLIQEIVGHSTRMMSRAYKTRGSRDRLVQAMELFSRQFMLPVGEHSDRSSLSA